VGVGVGVGVVAESSFTSVHLTDGVLMKSPRVGSDKSRKKYSPDSTFVSPLTVTFTVLVSSPGRKEIVPLVAT
jgi:hypothetical protein